LNADINPSFWDLYPPVKSSAIQPSLHIQAGFTPRRQDDGPSRLGVFKSIVVLKLVAYEIADNGKAVYTLKYLETAAAA